VKCLRCRNEIDAFGFEGRRFGRAIDANEVPIALKKPFRFGPHGAVWLNTDHSVAILKE
jgi:hypothetical protein